MIPGIIAGAAMAGAARLWTPAHLSITPKIWMDWNSPITSVSGFASEWQNSLGSMGNGFSQSTASRRPEVLDGELNGKRVLRFDGSDDGLTSNTLRSVLNGVGAAWSLLVFKKRSVDGAAANKGLLAVPSGGASIRGRYVIGCGHGGANKLNVIGCRLDTDSDARLDDPAAIGTDWIIRFNRVSYASGSAETVTNGVTEAYNATLITSTGITSGTDSARHIAIGSWVDGGSVPEFPIDADIAAVLLDSSPPSLAERQRLEGYYAHQCGLDANLPAAHPFRYVPPYVNTPALQPSFGSDPVVFGFVADEESGEVGVSAGPASPASFGTLLEPAPVLSVGQGIVVTASGSTITVRLEGLTPPVTPARARVTDHKGSPVADIDLVDGGGYFEGSEAGELEDAGVYYVRVYAP